jgi:hypothetical protein
MKTRLFALLIVLISAGLTCLGWYQLTTEGRYPLKVAAFAPVGIVGGLFLLLFPNKVGKPETTKDRIIVLLVFGVGLIAGLVNWYLMDPGFFGK